MIINIPLFFLAYKMMSRDYVICGIFGMIFYSPVLDSLDFMRNLFPGPGYAAQLYRRRRH